MNARHLKNFSSTLAAAEKYQEGVGGGDRRAIKGFGSGVKTPLDRICKEGINHIDLFLEHDEQPPLASEALKKADKLLVDRFMSIFFWPAVLSAVDRQDTNRRRGGENLFMTPGSSAAAASVFQDTLQIQASR